MSAIAENHVEEATLTWLNELGYAIPARRTAPEIGQLSVSFEIHPQLTTHRTPPTKPQGSTSI